MLLNWLPQVLLGSRGRTPRRSMELRRSRRNFERVEERRLLTGNPAVTLPASINFTEGATAALIAPSATFTDTQTANLTNGSIVITDSGAGSTSDTLGLVNQGTGAGQVSVSGNTVSIGGTAIGTLSGGTSGSPLIINLNGTTVTAADVQTILQDVSFDTAANATVGARTLNTIVADPTGGVAVGSETVNVLSNVVGPVLTIPTSTLNFTPGGAAANLASGATLTDTGVTDFSKATLTVTPSGTGSSNDTISLANANGVSVSNGNVSIGNTVIGTVSGGTNGQPLTVNFNASATAANVQTVLQDVTFTTTGGKAATTQTVQFSFNDGTNPPVTSTVTINVAAAPTPTLTLALPDSVTLNNSAPVTLAPNATFTDTTTGDLNGAKLHIAIQGGTPRDKLGFAGNSGVSVNKNNVMVNGQVIGTITGNKSQNETITFNSNATAASVQSVLQALTVQALGPHQNGTFHVTAQLTDSNGVMSNVANEKVIAMFGGHSGDHDHDDDGGNDNGQGNDDDGGNGNGHGHGNGHGKGHGHGHDS